MVDLPESNIKSSITVVVYCVSVSSAFMGYDTFATVGIPIVFSTPCGDILHGFGSSAWTTGAFA
jgi:hypothetical protein